MDGNDTSLETIKQLFYKQIRDLSTKTSTKANSFDVQFSGLWV